MQMPRKELSCTDTREPLTELPIDTKIHTSCSDRPVGRTGLNRGSSAVIAEPKPRAVPNVFSYSYPGAGRVVYGDDALSSLPSLCDSLKAERILLLTTPSLLDTTLRERVQGLLGERCVGVISDVAQHVPAGSVTAVIVQAYGMEPDLIVSLGGGSVTDTAKAVSAGLAQGYTDALSLYEHRIVFTYPDKVEITPFDESPVPIVSIPTTLSAAEYDGIFGMTSPEGIKDLYSDDRLMPKAVVLDPLATMLTPERLWLGSGIRALDHAVETYLSRTPTPPTDAVALHAIELLASNLPKSRRDPRDMQARLNCLVAGWLSMFGVANVTLGLSHGIGHQIGALCGVPHGETSCVMLPVVLDHLKDAVPERIGNVAKALGVDVSELSTEEAATAGVVAVRDFIAELGLPSRLSEVGVRKEDLPAIARASMADMVVAFAPVTVSEVDILDLLQRSW